MAKPLPGREGAGVTKHEKGAEPVVRTDEESAGLGVRASSGLVTDEYARFVPHVILWSPGSLAWWTRRLPARACPVGWRRAVTGALGWDGPSGSGP